MRTVRKHLKLLSLAALLAVPSPLLACATCFGKSDAPMAHGMNCGIFTLLGVIITVLAGIAGFFVYLIRRETAAAHPPAATTPVEV